MCECEVEGQMPKPKRRTTPDVRTSDVDCALLEALHYWREREQAAGKRDEQRYTETTSEEHRKSLVLRVLAVVLECQTTVRDTDLLGGSTGRVL